MEALVLCEIAAGREDLREALLARVGRLGLNGRAKLSFVARERNAPGNMLLAVGFPELAGAERFAAEAIGDGAALLDRIDALVPVLEASRTALINASMKLDANAAATDGRIAALMQVSATHAVKHIARRTEELARGSADVQARNMEATAREMFQSELAPALQSLSQTARTVNRWARWWACAGIAAIASAITCAATVFLLAG